MTVRIYREVLGREVNEAIFEMAMAQEKSFEPSRVSPRRHVDPATRRSSVIYDDKLTSIAAIIQRAVGDRMADAISSLGIEPFLAGAFELQLTTHNHGEFFARHTDSGSPATSGRALTYVYYFFREPKGFKGGEIVFFGSDGSETVVEPLNDMMVIFDPRVVHAVRPIECPSERFRDGRFTLNGWIHRREVPDRVGFFGRRIFEPVGSWPGARWAGPQTRGSTHLVQSAVRPTATETEELRHLRALVRLYGDLHRQGPRPDEVDVANDLSSAEFFANYYAQNRPVLMAGAMAGTRAVRTWSPSYLADRYGDVEVEITSGRSGIADYEQRFADLVETVTMADLMARLEATESSNDFYLVARNYLFENPRLAELRDDLSPPGGIINDADRSRGTAKVWIGPSGTVTPLHFDKHSILFTQIHGEKDFILIPSFDAPRMYLRDRFYSEVDPEHVDLHRHPLFGGASVMRVRVRPGDALYLPAGWWHWAKSLTTSMSVTFSSFAIPERNTAMVLA